MTVFDVPFDETVIPLRQEETEQKIRTFSPTGKVPVLIDGDVRVWESLAIIEYLAERFPEKGIWPKAKDARAEARACATEMATSFQALRRACPMNLGKIFVAKTWDSDVCRDVARIEQLWADARGRFGASGPFLFGDFCAADAMFAPVVSRLRTYQFEVSSISQDYMDAVFEHPAFIKWRSDAFQEPWHIGAYEDGHTIARDLKIAS